MFETTLDSSVVNMFRLNFLRTLVFWFLAGIRDDAELKRLDTKGTRGLFTVRVSG